MDYRFYASNKSWRYDPDEPGGWNDMLKKHVIIKRKSFMQYIYYPDLRRLQFKIGRMNDFRVSSDNFCRYFTSKLYTQRVYGIFHRADIYVFRWQPREKYKYIHGQRWRQYVLI